MDNLQSKELFRVEITAREQDVVVLELFGELDALTMSQFKVALDAVESAQAGHVIFDLSRAEFISGAGYAAIGRCALQLDRVTVCSKSDFAKKILCSLGYDRVLCVSTGCPK